MLLCRYSQSVKSFGLAFSVLIARFRCRASFRNASKAVCISVSRSAGRAGVFFALLMMLRQCWHSFL